MVCFVCACPIYIIDTVPNGEGCTTTDTQRYRYTDTLTDTDTTDTANNTANSRQINTIIDEIDTAIDEALKTESEKLYEEACSIISSPGKMEDFNVFDFKIVEFSHLLYKFHYKRNLTSLLSSFKAKLLYSVCL